MFLLLYTLGLMEKQTHTKRYRSHTPPKTPTPLSDLEKHREAAMASQSAQLLSLGLSSSILTQLTPTRTRKPKISKREIKLLSVTDPKLPSRTPSRAGAWTCVEGCIFRSTSLDCLLDHLKTTHELPFLTENLAPLGLGRCPFCDGVLCSSSRGYRAHKKL